MITIKDVAKEAGVSVSTASRALNNNPRISATTIEKVKKIAKKLDYKPNASAKTLSLGKANEIGVIYPVTADEGPANPFHIDLMRGINTALQLKNFVLSVAICQTEEALLNNMKRMVEQSQIHDFLLLYSKADDVVTNYLRKQKLNFVIIGEPTNENDRFIDNDNILAGREVTEFMLNQYNAKHPLFLRSTYNWEYEKKRELGYQQVMSTKSGSSPLIYKLEKNDNKVAIDKYMKHHFEIDAIIGADDIELLSFYHLLKENQHIKNIPAICFNNSRLISLAGPTVNKVDLRPRELGKKAVELLFDSELRKATVGFDII